METFLNEKLTETGALLEKIKAQRAKMLASFDGHIAFLEQEKLRVNQLITDAGLRVISEPK